MSIIGILTISGFIKYKNVEFGTDGNVLYIKDVLSIKRLSVYDILCIEACMIYSQLMIVSTQSCIYHFLSLL